jgi:predicted phosphodiesterase
MSTFSRLDALYKSCPRIKLEPPVVFIADTHLGDGSKADNFWPYRFNFEKAIEKYLPPWKIVTLGDIYDHWQFGVKAIRDAGYSRPLLLLLDAAVIKVRGNHDWEMEEREGSICHPHEAALLTIGGQEIFVAHGHQGDWINDGGRGLGRFLVRYLWTPLERLGVKQPPMPGSRHERQRVALVDWANTGKVLSVFGHTHTQENTGYAWICESPTTGKMRFIEFTDGLHIV